MSISQLNLKLKFSSNPPPYINCGTKKVSSVSGLSLRFLLNQKFQHDSIFQGNFVIGSDEVELFQSVQQKIGRVILGYDLHQMLAGKRLLTDHILDVFAFHKELIPIDWSDNIILFLGSFYDTPQDPIHVRCLVPSGKPSNIKSVSLNQYFGKNHYVALLK